MVGHLISIEFPKAMSSSNGEDPGKRFTILVSDDDHGVRRSIQLMLRARGYHVRGYTSGSALVLDPHSICADCLIVDYWMPDINGFALLTRLRAQGWQGAAIMISAYYDGTLERRAKGIGFDNVIAKPMIFRALLEAVAWHARFHVSR